MGSVTRDKRIFYATPYPGSGSTRGNFRQYVPEQTLNPTPNLVMVGNHLNRLDTWSTGSARSFRTLRQGTKTVNQHHDYTYGASRPSLRPVVVDDMDWLMSLDQDYNGQEER